MMSEIEASDEQADRLREIFEAARDDLMPARDDFRSFRDESGGIDRRAADPTATPPSRCVPSVSRRSTRPPGRMTEAFLEAAEVLTPEQRVALVEKFEERRWHASPLGNGDGGRGMADRVLIIDDDTPPVRHACRVSGQCRLCRGARRVTGHRPRRSRRHGCGMPSFSTSCCPISTASRFCRRIRATSDVPILMLTAKGDEGPTASSGSRSAPTTICRNPSARAICRQRLKAILRPADSRRDEPAADILRSAGWRSTGGSRAVRLEGPTSGH